MSKIYAPKVLSNPFNLLFNESLYHPFTKRESIGSYKGYTVRTRYSLIEKIENAEDYQDALSLIDDYRDSALWVIENELPEQWLELPEANGAAWHETVANRFIEMVDNFCDTMRHEMEYLLS